MIAASGESPRYATFEDPVARDGEILVEVSAAGLHPVVKSIASGAHYLAPGATPFVPGLDGVGRLEDGTRVFFGASRPPFGSFAQRSVTRPERCIPLSDTLDDATAAALANPAMSSWGALTVRAAFARGESVLVLGATGIAGKLAVQIARALGARNVIAAGRDEAALREVETLGADATVRLAGERSAQVAALEEQFVACGVDVVLDYVWGEPAEIALEAIASRPREASTRVRYVQIGSVAGPTISLASATLRSTPVELLGSGFGSASIDAIMRSLAEFFATASKHEFRIDVRAIPLRDVEREWSAEGLRARTVFLP